MPIFMPIPLIGPRREIKKSKKMPESEQSQWIVPKDPLKHRYQRVEEYSDIKSEKDPCLDPMPHLKCIRR